MGPGTCWCRGPVTSAATAAAGNAQGSSGTLIHAALLALCNQRSSGAARTLPPFGAATLLDSVPVSAAQSRWSCAAREAARLRTLTS
jgi:hypothetical protein